MMIQPVSKRYMIFLSSRTGEKTGLKKGLSDERSVLYILTNTRSYNAEKTENINREIVQNIVDVTQEMGINYSIISRSDSTLRGHYPLEINVLQDELLKTADVQISSHLIIPAFLKHIVTP